MHAKSLQECVRWRQCDKFGLIRRDRLRLLARRPPLSFFLVVSFGCEGEGARTGWFFPPPHRDGGSHVGVKAAGETILSQRMPRISPFWGRLPDAAFLPRIKSTGAETRTTPADDAFFYGVYLHGRCPWCSYDAGLCDFNISADNIIFLAAFFVFQCVRLVFLNIALVAECVCAGSEYLLSCTACDRFGCAITLYCAKEIIILNRRMLV